MAAPSPAIHATAATNQKRNNNMTGLTFEVKITAIGEVCDKDGNLLSAEPVEFNQTMTEQELQSFIEGEKS